MNTIYVVTKGKFNEGPYHNIKAFESEREANAFCNEMNDKVIDDQSYGYDMVIFIGEVE